MWSPVSRRHATAYSFVLVFAVIFVLSQFTPFKASAQKDDNGGSPIRTESHVVGLENYDFRADKSDKAVLTRTVFRSAASQSAASVADIRAGFVRGESKLRLEVPTLKIEYNTDIRIPEVIAPDVKKGPAFLTTPTDRNRIDALRSFAKRNTELTGVYGGQIDQLKVSADYTNPNKILSFTHLNQEIHGIPVFRGEIKAGFTKDGRIIRVINNLAPGIDYSSLSTEFGDPLEAVKHAARNIDYKLQTPDITQNGAASTDLKTVFGEGDWATTAEKMYFPVEPGVARPAWRVLIWQPVNAFYILVDAETGTVLWRKNITEDQTQSATYNVYANPTGYINVADSPFPLSPGPIDPSLGTQGPGVARTNQTFIGNEGILSFNNNGWINDAGDRTDGNAIQAGLDVVSPSGIDVNGEAIEVTAGQRDFVFTYNPYDPNTNTGDNPTGAAYRNGAVTQLFYITNRYHDALYQLGFTEPAGNFQHDNFGRGGLQGDRVSAEAQDFSGTNNANFSTPVDGIRGRMQMYRWTLTTPNIDGDLDADVIIHEFSHGLSNRLHGNSSGLSTNMSRGMGEGWGDFFAHALLSEAADPQNGVYAMGGYDTRNLLGGGLATANYYYGIRRFPKAVMSFTGGTGNQPHNPLTFADLDQTTVNFNDAAFPAPFGGHLSGSASQVHAAGEVWSSALWEVRALMITRLGFAAGNQRVMQVVTDGMKLAPIGPTFLQERDAILAAAVASGPDVADVWEGFRIRGMGFSATVDVAGGSTSTRVTEAFDDPNVVLANPGFAVSDAPGDGDGFPEPGELLLLTVPVENFTGATINNVAVNINGGPNVNYGNIAHGATVTNQIPYTVPGGTGCGSSIDLNINISGSRGPRTEVRTIIIGQPDAPSTENFDGVTAPALPANWTTAQTGAGQAFVTQTGSADSAPNSAFTPNTGLSGGNAGATLDSVDYAINTEAGVVSFRNNYNTEAGWDGGVLEISIGSGAFQDIITAGGAFIEGGYNGALGVNQNPLDGRAAWTGNSGGYIDTSVQLPASANGQNVKFRWRFGEDTNTSNVGWNIDSIEVFTGYTCSFAPSSDAKFDFDGDSKTDVSVFRPAPGEWWYLRSSDNGNGAFQFGTSTDTIVPADYTGDGKTDVAFFRPSTSEWFVLRSEDNSFFSFPFGTTGDIPAPGDYDGDGKADPAVFRPSSATWFINNSGGGTTIMAFGATGDQPVVQDYDGDGKDDIGIYRPSLSQWWINRSQDGLTALQFGAAGDQTVPGDFTGDSKADIAFFRPSTNEWFVLRSEDNSFFAFPFGAAGDIPVPGDYDGDGQADAAVFRPSTNTWFKQQSTAGFEAVAFGIANDIPVPNAYVRN